MFVLAEFEDNVRIRPWMFKRKLNDAIAEELNRKLANKVFDKQSSALQTRLSSSSLIREERLQILRSSHFMEQFFRRLYLPRIREISSTLQQR